MLQDPNLERLLDRLHGESDAQVPAMRDYFSTQRRPDGSELKSFWRDKLVALDRDKAEFCYQLCRALIARRIVEIGTSYGVSTLYLAAALRDNIAARGGTGRVIGTEHEPEKVLIARRHFAEAGVQHLIELREGDLCQTLKTLEGPVDFLLMDIWIPMARPALALVAPHLRPGAVVVSDNTDIHRDDYRDYLAALALVAPHLRPGAVVVSDNTDIHRDDYRDYLAALAQGFRTMTLPFRGGLELSVRD